MAEDEKIADKTQEDATSQAEDTCGGSSSNVNAEIGIVVSQLDHKDENLSDDKQMVINESDQSDKIREVADAELNAECSRSESECDFILDELMDTLDVVDSWVDTADDECLSESFNKSEEEESKSNDTIKLSDNKNESSNKRNDSPNQKKNVLTSEDKNNKNISKSSARNDCEKKSGSRENSKQDKNKSISTVHQSRSAGRISRRKHPSRDVESGSRRDRSPRFSRSSDYSRRNTDRGVDSLSSSKKVQGSKLRKSRTRSKERDTHNNSMKNVSRKSRGHNSESNKKPERKVDQEKQSAKGKEVVKQSTTVTDRNIDNIQTKLEKGSPAREDLMPPGAGDKFDKDQVHTSLGDCLVPPGTEEVLLPGLKLSREREEIRSSKRRKLSSTDHISKFKSSMEVEVSKFDKEKLGEKRRRLTCTEEGRTREPRTDRERIARDQERVSRELSLERLRESRNRDMFDRSRYQSRERYSPDRRLQESRARRSASFGRRSSRERYSPDRRLLESRARRSASFGRRSIVDSRWEAPDRDRYRRRYGDLSPISPGRMSRGSPLSFEFSPVSSRSSSRERLRIEYQRNKFRSYSPISSGSDLSRSLLPISSDEERESRSRRRRRLPFLDEMERKLGLKLTGGHNINQQLRTSRQFPLDPNAPPPGIYPMNFPPPIQYPVPTPAAVPISLAVNPVYPPFAPAPGPPFIPGPIVADPPPNTPVAPTTACPSSNISQPYPPHGRQLVTIPREPLKVKFKFQRPIQNQLTEVPEAPPPPTISAGAVEGDFSLSSLLEASVKVAGKNPVDEARLERCAVAIQTLQEDESFSMITLGRFVVQDTPDKARYSSIARFDNPAQESMFKLKSPLLRNQVVSLKFTSPSVVPSKPSLDQIPIRNSASVVVANKSSGSQKDVEKSIIGKKEGELKEDDDDEDNVCIVEMPNTVVSISSESDHDMNLSLVSDISDVSADEVDDCDDKLENVSSGEEDFNNQCYTCTKCNQVNKLVDASTQYESLDTRSIVVQVDFVNQQLMGTCDVFKSFEGPTRSLGCGGQSNASTISSYSNNELRPASPSRHSRSRMQKPVTVSYSKNVSASGRRFTAQSFLESVSDNSYKPSMHSSSQSGNIGSSSTYKPFVNSANQFSSGNSPNLPSNRYKNQLDANINSPINANKSFQDEPSSISTQNYSGSTPFHSSFSNLNSGNLLDSVSKSDSPRGILKSSHSGNVPSSLTSSFPASSGSSFQRDPLQYQGGSSSLQEIPQSFGNQGSVNQQLVPMSPFHGASMSRSEQPLPFSNQGNQNQTGTAGQSFQGGCFFNSAGIANPQGPQTQPFRSGVGCQRQQDTIIRPPFQGTSGLGQPFSSGPVCQNQSFQTRATNPLVTGNMSSQTQQSPFQSRGSFGQQPVNIDFGNRFGNAGNRPAVMPPPNPVPAPTHDQQTFLQPPAGPRIGSSPVRMNQPYFGTTPRQQNNYYEHEPY